MLQIRDVMTRDVLTVTPETTLREAAELFARRHVSGAPVVVGEKVVGVVSATDLLDFIASNPGVPNEGGESQPVDGSDEAPGWEDGDVPPAAYFSELWADVGAETGERFVERGGPEWDTFSEHTVAEVMTRKVCSLPPDLPVTAAADYMRKADMHRVLVLEQGRLVGIVTSLDVARAAAEHKLTERRYVFDRHSPGP
jgi:CBS domain-containing protein